MKTILKSLLTLLLGIAIGLAIVAVGAALFTDISLREFASKLLSIDLGELFGAAVTGIAAFVASICILIPIHEAGHLAGGLMTGYKFVSFRLFSYTIIRIDGSLRVKRFAVAGTGGQCLMSPPDLPSEQVPTALYGIGGVAANVVALIAALALLFAVQSPMAKEAILILILSDAFIILLNGIPMKMGGIGNDGYNLSHLRKNPTAKRGLLLQLRANAMIQNGVRPKDMPAEWFIEPACIDYRNPLEVSIELMIASRLVDEERNADALLKFETLYERKNDIMELYVKEIACELIYLKLICGEEAKAKALLDESLRQYIERYRKVMSSKERILCAIALIGEKNRDKAREIYLSLKQRQDQYLLQGEVKSDLALMEAMLK